MDLGLEPEVSDLRSGRWNSLTGCLHTYFVFEIDKILKERGKGAKKEYFVSFVGFDNRFNQWVSDIV